MGVELGLTLVLVPVGLWWIGTGLVLRDAHAEEDRTGRALPFLTVAVPAALAGLALLGMLPATAATALVSFVLVFGIWAWLEVSFYSGLVTGPVKERCPSEANVARRLVHALGSSAYHEAAMVGLGLAIWAISSGGSHWAPYFFAVLAVMHTSARINVVLGVRNLNEHFLPRKLAYLGGLFRQRAWNGLLPFSVVASTMLTVVLIRAAASTTGESAVGLILLATLAAIGLVEHLLLVLPLPGHLLFEWGLPASRDEA